MSEPKAIIKWLRVVAILQSTLFFLLDFIFTKRIFAIADALRDSLYRTRVAEEQVHQTNQAFSSIASDLMWIFLGGVVLTVIGYSLLEGIIKKNWPKPTVPDANLTDSN